MIRPPSDMAERFAATSVISATAAVLQTMTSAAQASSLAYLAAVRQFNATATLELSTLATACNQLLAGSGGMQGSKQNENMKMGAPLGPAERSESAPARAEATARMDCNCNRWPPPGYPVVT